MKNTNLILIIEKLHGIVTIISCIIKNKHTVNLITEEEFNEYHKKLNQLKEKAKNTYFWNKIERDLNFIVEYQRNK